MNNELIVLDTWPGDTVGGHSVKSWLSCSRPGSISASDPELRDKLWSPQVDGYRPELGSDLSGCAREFWDLIGRLRQRHMDEVLEIQPEGLNDIARDIVDRRTRENTPPSQGGIDPGHGSHGSIDLSKAERMVRRLRSPF